MTAACEKYVVDIGKHGDFPLLLVGRGHGDVTQGSVDESLKGLWGPAEAKRHIVVLKGAEGRRNRSLWNVVRVHRNLQEGVFEVNLWEDCFPMQLVHERLQMRQRISWPILYHLREVWQRQALLSRRCVDWGAEACSRRAIPWYKCDEPRCVSVGEWASRPRVKGTHPAARDSCCSEL